jgi:hypothetical protein
MSICNITTESDADFYRGFIYKTALGVGIDLTGVTMKMLVRAHAEDATLALSLTSADGDIVISNTPTGSFTVRITQAKLLLLNPGEYVHSLIMTQVDGLKVPIWRGTLVHSMGPSR